MFAVSSWLESFFPFSRAAVVKYLSNPVHDHGRRRREPRGFPDFSR